MDHMDIDDIVDVPDTPDRLAKHGINGRNGVKNGNQRLTLLHHGHKLFPKEGSRDQPMILDSGSPRPSLHHPKCSSSPRNPWRPPTSASLSLASASSSRNTNLFRKGVTEKKPSSLTHNAMHKHQESMRASHTSPSSSSRDDGVLDLREWSDRPACGNASSKSVRGNNRADLQLQKRSGLPKGASSAHERSNSANASCNDYEVTNNAGRGSFSIAFGEGACYADSNKKKPESSSICVVPPRVNKQKRLVRNGCISPNNIAKAKQLVGKDSNGSVPVAHSNGSIASNALPVSIEIRDLVAEDDDSHARKGKGVISHPCSSWRLDWDTNNLHGRSSMSYIEKVVETSDHNGGAGKSVEETGAWRSTRNRTREPDNMSLDKEHDSIRERATPMVSNQHHEKNLDRRGKGIAVANGDNHSKEPGTISEQLCAQSLKESVSHSRVQLGRLNGQHSTAHSLIERQKQGSGLSRQGECSTSISDDQDVVLLSSPREAVSLRSTSSNPSNIPQIIEVDESPPQLRHATPDEDDDKARQVEADELLARELQEQFYNEMPVFGVQEVDEHTSLRNQDHLNHGSRGRQQALDPRVLSNLHRQFHSRSSSNAPRRGAPGRSSSLGRMTRLRSRFPGQSRTLSSSRGRTSMFPPDMDVDMRMHILGALEEFSALEPPAGILNADRDFNENDYEMLLALDDNINHGGASAHQINGLPLSTAQSDFDEACAVCLETPTTGDTIRHLPCLHKFHKDCIDPWLRRRTSCPVCKSSVT